MLKIRKINTIIALRLSRSIYDWENLLKTSKLNKKNYILSKSDKDLLIDFINQVDKTNKEYDKIQNLSNALTNVDEQFKEKDNEMSFLKSKISSLKNTVEYWKDKFDKLISLLHSKLYNWYDNDDKYIDVVNDMYEDNVLDDNDIKDLKLSKEKDDFER